MEVHQNQVDAANEILKHFISGKTRCCLYAQMQSGKTGTYKWVIELIRNTVDTRKKLNIKKFIVFLADSNTPVKNQIIKDLNIQNYSDIEVYHRSDVSKMSKNVTNTLFILDESHVAQKDFNIPGRVMKNIKNGTNLILTVSATDFANSLLKPPGTPEVILNPGPNYYGVSDMLKDRRVKSSEAPLDGRKLSSRFADAIEELEDFNKYGVVRIKSAQMAASLQKAVVNKFKNKISVRIVNSKENKNDMDLSFLNVTPARGELVIVNGTARLGKQIDTTNLLFMWDTSKGNTDTINQSFVGRCCGYNKAQNCVTVYTDKEQVVNYKEFVEKLFNSSKVSFKTEGLRSTKTLVSSEIPYRISNVSFPKTFNKLNKTEKINFLSNYTEVKELIQKYGAVETIRNFANSSDLKRKNDVVQAMVKGEGYDYGIKDSMYTITVDTNCGEIFLFEQKLSKSVKIEQTKKDGVVFHHEH